MAAEDRKRQILDAAIGVFARLGYHGAGTADIASAAEIGEPTIYRYFKNKRELHLEAVKRCRLEITENWQRIVDTSENAEEALQRIATWYYEEINRNPQLLVLRFRTLSESGDPEAVAVVRQTYMRNKRIVQDLYEQARREGSLAEDADPNTLAWLFMAIGAIIDVTHLLEVDDDFGAKELDGIGQFFDRSVWTQQPSA